MIMKKKFNNFRTLAVLLIAGTAFAACSSNDDNIIAEQPANPGEHVYTLTINASKGDGATTRALDLDGTGKLTASWANGEKITVRKRTTKKELGTLTASNASGNTATFSGTLTGNVNIGEHLILAYHDIDFNDFANQDGTLKGENGAEKYDVAATDYIDVTGIDDNGDITVTCVDSKTKEAIPGDPTFRTVTAMLKLKLQDKNGHAFNATSLTISFSPYGELFTFKPTADTYATNGDGILYFALPTINDGQADAYQVSYLGKYDIINEKGLMSTDALDNVTVTFTATVDGNEYSASKKGYKFAAGKYYTATLTLGLDGGIATVNENITGWTSTEFPGALPGLFTIDDAGHKVNFSKGNLQATTDGSSWTWAFAEQQWDCHHYYLTDLFGWVGASSTWVDEALLYGITSLNYNYTKKADGYGNLTGNQGEFLKSDWGNLAITNGGGAAGSGWRTLTRDEWEYVFNTRSGATVNSTPNVRYTMANVALHRGVILFPDGVTFAADEVTTWGTLNGASAWATYCDDAQWEALEAKGCVFLPAAGYRSGTSVSSVGTIGLYWSSSPYTDVASAYCVYFYSSYMNPADYFVRSYGFSVRLVRDAE